MATEGAKGMLLAVVGEEAVYTEDDYLYDYFFFYSSSYFVASCEMQ